MKKLLLILMLILSIGIYGKDSGPTITMNGVGQIKVAPDTAVISFGIEHIGKELAPLKKENDIIGKKAVDALLKAGISKDAIYTSSYTISQNYDYRIKKEPREKVYTVKNQFNLTIKDLNKIGELITLLESNGINTIQGITYSSSKQEELNLKALELAYLDAKKKAGHLAALEGYKVEISSVSAGGYSPRTEVYMASDMNLKSTPIYTPNEILINTSVTGVFKLIK